MEPRQSVVDPKATWGLWFAQETDNMPTGWTNVDTTLEGLSNGNANISVQYDLGDELRSEWWRWRASFAFTASITAGELMRLYLAGSHVGGVQARVDGSLQVAKTSGVTVAQLANADNFGAVNTTLQTGSVQSGLVRIMDQYISLVVENATAGVTTSTTNGVNWVALWPRTPIEASRLD